jgi:hypothetical protein
MAADHRQPVDSSVDSHAAAPEAFSKATLWPFAISVLAPGIVLLTVLAITPFGRSVVSSVIELARVPRTVEDRLLEFGEPARTRWRERLAANGIPYPPANLALLGLKDERVLEIYAAAPTDPSTHGAPATPAWRLVAAMPIVAASGAAGPKLREGDLQVPEGIYRIESLNPNSSFHAALRLDYPNEFDRSMASRDGRAASATPLGGDIMIHGGDRSVGCLAMGDSAIEELFTLVADSGREGVRVVIAPWDLRARAAPDAAALSEAARGWSPELYRAIARVMAEFPRGK